MPSRGQQETDGDGLPYADAVDTVIQKETQEDGAMKQGSTMLLAGCLGALVCGAAMGGGTLDLPQPPDIARPYLRVAPVAAIPASLETVFDKDARYEPRIKAVDRLGTHLDGESVAAILGFLHRRVEEDTLAPLQLDAIKNNLCNALMRQDPLPAEFGLHLVAMFYDRSFDMAWRDYCLQFLGRWYPHAQGDEERAAVAKTLWDATLETDAGLAGTALIALGNLTDQPGIGRQKVMDAALEIATNVKAADLSRITAIQVCARLEDRRILSHARALVGDGKASVPVRVSAVGAIGLLGVPTDIALLEEAMAGADSRIAVATQAAVKRLK
jgi:hypothetical protein